MHDAALADGDRDQVFAGQRGRVGLAHRGHRFRGELIVRDEIDMVPIPAIDGAQHALAEPRGVLDDPVEHRLDAGRRVRDQAQDLGCRGLPLPGFLKFERKPFGFCLAGLSTLVFAGLETRAAFGAWRRFAVVVAWLRDLVGLSPAFIACLKSRDKPSYRLKPAMGKGVRRLLGSKQKSRLVFAASAARVKQILTGVGRPPKPNSRRSTRLRVVAPAGCPCCSRINLHSAHQA